MSDQPNNLDEQVRQHYAEQSLDAAELAKLTTMIGATRVERPRRHAWIRYAAAAMVVLTVGVMWNFLRPESSEKLSQALAMQIVQQHMEPFKADVPAEDFAGLKSSMPQLAFAPIEPQRCKQDDYRVIGARYAMLHGQKVAQIRLAYVDGPPLTLYEMRPDQFPNLREGTMKLDGVPVTFWTEGGLMMALAGTPLD